MMIRLNEYSKKLINQLMVKFKPTTDDSDETILQNINDFEKFITYSGISNDEEVRTMFAKWLMSRKNLKVLDVDSIIPVLLNIIPIK